MSLLDEEPEKIIKKIKRGELKIGIVGLGLMGLSTACLLLNKGASIIGYDVDYYVLKQLNGGKSPVFETGLSYIIEKSVKNGKFRVTDSLRYLASNCEVIIITVPTLVDENKNPDYSNLVKVARKLGLYLKRGSLLILMSTVGPGVTEEIFKTKLEEISGLKAGRDFGLAYSPIRASAGSALHDIEFYPRILGAIDKKSLEISAAVLSVFVKNEIIKVSSIKTAETVKLFENIYRDVNIALANELAILCEKIGVDFYECRNAANTQPYCNILLPGAGVGGHCIPVNPYFLLKKAEEVKVKLQLVKTARKVNDRMPKHVIKLVREAFRRANKSLFGARIAIFGISYKPNVKNHKYSVVWEIVDTLKKRGCYIRLYDPYYTSREIKALGYNGYNRPEKAAEKSDCIILVTAHNDFKKLRLKSFYNVMRKPPVIVDCTGFIEPDQAEKHGFIYFGVGRSKFD